MTMFTATSLLVLLVACLVHLGDSNIPKVPGTLPNSFKISGDRYACPVRDGLPGTKLKAELTVTLCTGSSSHAVTCTENVDSSTHTLVRGKNVTVIEGNEHFFNTYGLARYFGKETCVSWVYIETNSVNHVVAAECRSKCLSTSLAPQVVLRVEADSSGKMYSEQYYKFEAKESTGSKLVTVDFLVEATLLSYLLTAIVGDC